LFVREDAKALASEIGDGSLALTCELRDGASDGIVEAEIERPKLLCGHRYVELNGKLRDGLTDISVIMNDLSNRKPHMKQVLAVATGASADLRVVDYVARFCDAQRVAELIQEDWDPILKLYIGRLG
jgi:hypothetical protein